MKGIHRIINHNWNALDTAAFEKYALKCEPEYSLIYLDHDVYRSLVAEGILVISPDCSRDILTWLYSREEIQESEYCLLNWNRYYCGYPQPEDTYGEFVYDPATLCKECGIDHQIHDFRVKKVSKHLMWGFFAWDFEPLFVECSLYDELFKPRGIECRPLRYVSGKLRDDFVQLVIPVIDEDMDKSYIIKESVCPQCGRKKYIHDLKKPFFPLHNNPLPHIYMTKEFFGAGGVRAADRKIIISTDLALELVKRKALKLEHLTPCHKNIEEFLKKVDY